MPEPLIVTPFGPESTAMEVVAGVDLAGRGGSGFPDPGQGPANDFGAAGPGVAGGGVSGVDRGAPAGQGGRRVGGAAVRAQ